MHTLDFLGNHPGVAQFLPNDDLSAGDGAWSLATFVLFPTQRGWVCGDVWLEPPE
ncbi:MAG: hypothetical protein ABJ370_03760 [Paracoccaceae bacterium]